MLTKMVNGIKVVCAAEEEAAILAVWAANVLPKTQAEIDAEKAAEAAKIVDSPSLKSAIEEFTSILQAASIPVPVDIMTRITNRVKAKL